MTQQDPKQFRPVLPSEVSPFQVILGQMQSLRASLPLEGNVERAQETLRGMDRILKDLSDLQRDLGVIRKAAGSHVQNLRQANPKGKPVEGTIRTVKGNTYIFLGGSWAPYVAHEPPKE